MIQSITNKIFFFFCYFLFSNHSKVEESGTWDLDEAEKILRCKKLQSGEITFDVQWKARADGTRPAPTTCDNKTTRDKIP